MKATLVVSSALATCAALFSYRQSDGGVCASDAVEDESRGTGVLAMLLTCFAVLCFLNASVWAYGGGERNDINRSAHSLSTVSVVFIAGGLSLSGIFHSDTTISQLCRVERNALAWACVVLSFGLSSISVYEAA